MTPPSSDLSGVISPHVLLIEDDVRLAGLLTELLTGQGFDVEIARDGQAGLHAGLTRGFDVMVVDRGLPAIEGVDLVARLRSKGVFTPVLILTARGSLSDRVEGLDAGADDYLSKPFEVPELLARMRALLRRHDDRRETLSLGHRRLDLAARRVIDEDGGEVPLTGRECAFLTVLASNPTRVFTRDELLEQVFEADTQGEVDTYVSYLRRKLGKDAIVTVHGLGYRLGSG